MRDPLTWQRLGRGRERQFFATDREVEDLLLRGLPEQWSNYRLLGTKDSTHNSPRRDLFRCAVGDVVRCCARSAGHIMWLMSADVTDPQSWDGTELQALAAINGLILIEHGFRRRGRQEASRIALVDRVRNVETGETAINVEYLAIFQAIDRVIRDSLQWSSVRELDDGTLDEDTEVALMTSAAARAAQTDPSAWSVRPGRSILPKR